MTRDALLHEITALPGREWWHTSSMERFLALAMKMRTLGLGDHDILDILSTAYAATANEFGA